jgi:hypothetical protein
MIRCLFDKCNLNNCPEPNVARARKAGSRTGGNGVTEEELESSALLRVVSLFCSIPNCSIPPGNLEAHDRTILVDTCEPSPENSKLNASAAAPKRLNEISPIHAKNYLTGYDGRGGTYTIQETGQSGTYTMTR